MPKRANPFVDDFIKQTKTHVSSKQYNNNDERLSKVYEKTLKLLFKGAKSAPVAKTPLVAGDNSNRVDKLRQLFIGNNGTLQPTGSLVACKSETKSLQCSCIASSKEMTCAYCEKWLCEPCCQLCDYCQKHYCGRCSFDSDNGSSVCVSCYS